MIEAGLQGYVQFKRYIRACMRTYGTVNTEVGVG